MLVNHGRTVARLLGSQVFVPVRGVMVGAKGMAEAVRFARHLGVFAELAKLLLPDDFGALGGNGADIASGASAEVG